MYDPFTYLLWTLLFPVSIITLLFQLDIIMAWYHKKYTNWVFWVDDNFCLERKVHTQTLQVHATSSKQIAWRHDMRPFKLVKRPYGWIRLYRGVFTPLMLGYNNAKIRWKILWYGHSLRGCQCGNIYHWKMKRYQTKYIFSFALKIPISTIAM